MESVIKQRIYLLEQKNEIRVALPPVLRLSTPYTSGDVFSAMELPSKSQMVVAVYDIAGRTDEWYYYDFVGVDII